ncbi:MAG: hypothetical protein JRH16_16685 [Deltaproteobacteria bacterium]|nr:hypothetical protein [Deltaproteobacteria bacterium]MBW2417410.1 hypothetical protein [Deltaproteobacteria bacterium]
MHPSPTSIEPEGLFDGLRPRAILSGAVLDNLATIATSIVLFGLFAGEGALSEDPEVANAAWTALSTNPLFLFCSVVLGLSCTVLGAFVGAWRAGVLHVRHGGWIAVASAAIGTLFLLLPGEASGAAPPLWYDVVGWALLIPAGVLGGALAAALQARNSA